MKYSGGEMTFFLPEFFVLNISDGFQADYPPETFSFPVSRGKIACFPRRILRLLISRGYLVNSPLQSYYYDILGGKKIVFPLGMSCCEKRRG